MDLISYEVISLSPQLRVKECAVGSGDFCGSSFIDRAFENHLKERMGPIWTNFRPETQSRIIKNFEEVKCAFEDRPEKEKFYVSIPTIGTINDPRVRITDGEMEITRYERI